MWNDALLDERFRAIDQRFDRLEADLRAFRAEMYGELAAIRADINSLRNTLVQAAFGVIGVLIAEIVALVIALS